jgi:hypothetical protein
LRRPVAARDSRSPLRRIEIVESVKSPQWKTTAHLDVHFSDHGRLLRCRSQEEFDASAQATITLGVAFTYRDRITGLPRMGYFHRDTSRFVGMDVDGRILTHFRAAEDYVADQPYSTYKD